MSQLADVDTPLIKPDGTVIQPVGRGVSVSTSASASASASAQSFQRIELVAASKAQRIVGNTTRKLLDIPLPPGQVSTLSTVMVYTASGLVDAEIAVALNLPVTQVRQIKDTQIYQQLESYMIAAVRAQVDEEVKDILARGAVKAAEQVVSLVHSEDDKTALAASKDVLDRTGHKVADRIDINMQMRNTFRIEVVDKREAANDIPTIEGELLAGDE